MPPAELALCEDNDRILAAAVARLREIGSWTLTTCVQKYDVMERLSGRLAQLKVQLGECEARFKELHTEHKKTNLQSVKDNEKSYRQATASYRTSIPKNWDMVPVKVLKWLQSQDLLQGPQNRPWVSSKACVWK